jgi:hypothetical protein
MAGTEGVDDRQARWVEPRRFQAPGDGVLGAKQDYLGDLSVTDDGGGRQYPVVVGFGKDDGTSEGGGPGLQGLGERHDRRSVMSMLKTIRTGSLK